ncbi:uncharacterized protein PRD47_000339 isoform 2-T3 [Ara ararauna]
MFVPQPRVGGCCRGGPWAAARPTGRRLLAALARWTRSPARSNNGAPNRAGRGAESTRVSVAPLCSATAPQVLPTAAITPLLRSASPSRGRMETPGVMSAVRPGTDRQQEEEEEPRPGATDGTGGPPEWLVKGRIVGSLVTSGTRPLDIYVAPCKNERDQDQHENTVWSSMKESLKQSSHCAGSQCTGQSPST